ncbi:alpha-hydroxy acid oxidase [Aspergillus puulaauensis]|uniref:FMN hydroxy acid dehydrogenase domain-containing protein n=1 Tax=Aspergillus puulaauensis TaxID=1220207 RepID=A0A7R7X9N6_9EURO|nr:uncharacterized protein APUU_10230S [Aspergillus puulaauensis]BCS17402.1 hypothetical protein APUU_10230S [Aspergillus puulaauensis]
MPGPESPTTPITVADFKEIARQRLEKPVWDYYNAGADDENTINRNEEIYKKVLLRPQVLRNVANVDTATTIFGKRYDIPIAVAPTAYQKLVSADGEIDVARACRALGTNFILSTNATTTMEDVIEALPSRGGNHPSPWFQLYFLGDRNVTAALIKRAEAAGYEALVLTVDTAVLGNRLPMRKNPFKLPPGLSMENVKSRSAGGVNKARLLLEARTAADAKKVAREHSSALVDASLSWEEVIPWLRSQTEMKIILKGIMTAEDAVRAVEAGVDAIVVSNHGGRQLDGVPSTLEMLPEISDAVKGVIPILFDGGISKGSDVFKTLALGADLCLIGRSALWGLAYDGQAGLESVFHILERELWRTMALMGVDSLAGISRSMLGRARENGFGVSKL